MKNRFPALFAILLLLLPFNDEKAVFSLSCGYSCPTGSVEKIVISVDHEYGVCGAAVCLNSYGGAEYLYAENLTDADMTVIPGIDTLVLMWNDAENSVSGDLAALSYRIPEGLTSPVVFELSAPEGVAACRRFGGIITGISAEFPEATAKLRIFDPSEPIFVGCQETKTAPDGTFTVRCWFASGGNTDMSQIEVSCDGFSASTPTESTYILSGKQVFTPDFFGCADLFYTDIVIFANGRPEISVKCGDHTYILRYDNCNFTQIIG